METINELIYTGVERYKERPVLVEPVEESSMSSLTYGGLLERAQGFAGYLQAEKVERGERMLLWSASRIDWMVAFLGALLVGAVIVPLDVNSKEDFLSRVKQTTEAKYLITTQKQYSGLKHPPAPLIPIDALPGRGLATAKLPTPNARHLAELAFHPTTKPHPN